jgi:enamine deaminase RidA (YjgF/YER057c/UK114 family)
VKVLREGRLSDSVQVSSVEAADVREYFFCVRPAADVGDVETQARSIYESLFAAMDANGVEPKDLVTEKIFFSDVDRQFRILEEIRSEVYRQTVEETGCTPATTFLHQPPCYPGRLCELQAFAVVPTDGATVETRCADDMPGLASGKVVSYDGLEHIYLLNLTGNGAPDAALGLEDQAEKMFERADACLERHGASYQDVIRTWIYLADIERDYGAFNPVRTVFHERRGLARIPASTGIQGATYPWTRGCTLDLYALRAGPSAKVGDLYSPTMNEATAYGSSFSRGTTVTFGGRTTAYVSGTASIDTEGRVVHVGDIAGQVRRMLENVEALLDTCGASWADSVSAITYLKHPEYLEPFLEGCRERGILQDVPNTIAVADVCGPEWLCEIETIAVFPEGGRQAA